MQLATTLQFRKAVRKYAEKNDLYVGGSWTNPSELGRRTVGMWMSGATATIAAKIEKKLNKKGLTAKTRCTSNLNYGNYAYIRGTCAFTG